MIRYVLVCSYFFMFLNYFTNAELFTALVDLEKLLYTEAEIIKTLETYLQEEERRLQQIRSIQKEYGRMYRVASQDVQAYLSNPLNAYLLVKRLTTDWKLAEKLILGDEAKRLVVNISSERPDLSFPDQEDLSGAALALLRLQDTYKLDTASLARGQIEGATNSEELSAGDCFELGRQSYNSGDHHHTILWMQESLDRLEDEITPTASRGEILEYLAFSLYMDGHVRHALKITNELLEIVPNHPRALGNKVYFEDSIKKTEIKKRGDDGDLSVEWDSVVKEQSPESPEIPEREMYERLCRGEKGISDRIESGLKCHYRRNHPFYYLMPVREEELYPAPRIVVFHNVLTDREIEIVKSLAQPKLKRATVQNYKSGELEVANYRISKSAWLKNVEHEVVAKWSQRIEDITGLTTSTAEELQVVNYGIGGHYEPHYDFARREEKNAFKSLGTGNRIATWLSYMSDIDAGGGTVFPQLGITVWPRKGSAVFWHNLHKNGEGDLLTRHAACPVLAGSKWVSNKWFHERGQEFRRPCGLKFND